MAFPPNTRFRVRPAEPKDVDAITDVFFASFNAPFFRYVFPPNDYIRGWMNETWALGLKNPTDRSFCVEDTEKENRIVAFSRWMVPQQDGNLERKYPAMDESQFDMSVAGAFFVGMEQNRAKLEGKRPHWYLEFLGVHEDYQKRGIGAVLMKWGTDQADRDGLDTYLDGSEIGQPYYIKYHHYKFGADVHIPDNPAYGSFAYKSLVRPAQPVE